MSKVFPVVTLCAFAIITTLLLNGCESKQETSVATKSNPQHLSMFLSLHNKFCEKRYASPDSLRGVLAESTELKLAKNYEGVYEVLVGDISFAVSPEEDGCTTDVMIQQGGKQLFTYEDIDNALISSGYIETGDPVSRIDRGEDQTELTVIEKKYISPSGEITTLDFPLEKKDKYYMTLFSEKFTGTKRETKERLLRTLKMASL